MLTVDNSLVEKWQPLLRRMAWSLDAEQAEDLVQLAWVRILERAPKYDPQRAKVGTWIGTVGYSGMIDWLRKDRPEDTHGPADIQAVMMDQDILEASPEELLMAFEKLIELFEEVEND